MIFPNQSHVLDVYRNIHTCDFNVTANAHAFVKANGYATCLSPFVSCMMNMSWTEVHCLWGFWLFQRTFHKADRHRSAHIFLKILIRCDCKINNDELFTNYSRMPCLWVYSVITTNMTTSWHGPLARYAKLRVRMHRLCRERFPRHRR